MSYSNVWVGTAVLSAFLLGFFMSSRKAYHRGLRDGAHMVGDALSNILGDLDLDVVEVDSDD